MNTFSTESVSSALEVTQPLTPHRKPSRFSGWGFWATKGFLTVLDQGLIAGSNFAVGIFLARWLSPEQYGSYAMAFALFLLLSLSYQSLVLEPQRVFGPTDYADCFQSYLGSLLKVHLGAAIMVVALLGVSAWIVAVTASPGSLPAALIGVMFSAPCVLFLWLARGAYYVRLSPQHAVLGAGVYCVVLTATFALALHARILSPLTAFLITGFAALFAGSVLMLRLKPAFAAEPMLGFRNICGKHWEYGRWILLSSVLSWMTGEIYYPVVTAFSGLSAAGNLKALLNFSQPAAQALSAISILVIPYASKSYGQSGNSALAKITATLSMLFAIGSTMYWLALILCSKFIIHALYGSRYPDLPSLLPWLAAASIPWSISYVPAIGLRVVRSSVDILKVYSASSAASVLIGIPATKFYGLHGALGAMLLANLIALITCFFLLKSKMQETLREELK